MLDKATSTGADGPRGARPALIVVAHPDDEVIGCGALMARLSDVAFVQVTKGAPTRTRHHLDRGFATSEAFGEARWRETLAALALAGVDPSQCHNLGLEDQRVAHAMPELARRLVPFVRRAGVVYTHAYEGGHPDHDATAFAIHASRRLLAGPDAPDIHEMPFYRAGAEGWLRQSFVRVAGADPARVSWLTPSETALKLAMRDCHRTQARTLKHFHFDREQFRRAPGHDFARRIGELPPLYPRYGGPTEEAWAALVEDALHELGLAPAPARAEQLTLV